MVISFSLMLVGFIVMGFWVLVWGFLFKLP